ncbi:MULTISPECIES: hypothetical protein [Escherichia]|uniref:hypothetical protein n=1 Tax=Escherichia TaxID=561 RepID=UPI0005F97526|nr:MULTISPECIES: hypothetical protein [Escherichia]MCZ8925482.1 hypothetical protein [Escherichia albertii]EFG1984949.1 hypothetical protein [Escherichia coli]EFK2454012.1 hypothetical protein [Escherichia coli]EFK3427952.1 hypothetical protein [Escherichia coli]EHK6259880.1 hypothetical protein [Escherichia coli]
MQELMQNIAMWMMEKQYGETTNGSILVYGLVFLSVILDAFYYLFFKFRDETPVKGFGGSVIFVGIGYVLSGIVIKRYISIYGGTYEMTPVQYMNCILPQIILPVLAILLISLLFYTTLKMSE